MLEVILCFLSGILLARFLKLRVDRAFILLTYTLIFLIGAEFGSEVPLFSLSDIAVRSIAIASSTLIGTALLLLSLKRTK